MFLPHKDIEITLFNAYLPVPKIEMRGSPVMERMSGQLSHLTKMVYEKEAALKKAKDEFLKKGFSSDKVNTLFVPVKKEIVNDIIELVTSEKYNAVVLNRKSGKISGFFTGSTFNKIVTSLKNVNVFIVT